MSFSVSIYYVYANGLLIKTTPIVAENNEIISNLLIFSFRKICEIIAAQIGLIHQTLDARPTGVYLRAAQPQFIPPNPTKHLNGIIF